MLGGWGQNWIWRSFWRSKRPKTQNRLKFHKISFLAFFCKKYWSQRYQNLYSSSHQYSLQMLFYKNVSISKKIKIENGHHHHHHNNNNFDSSMVWASPQTKKDCCLKIRNLNCTMKYICRNFFFTLNNWQTALKWYFCRSVERLHNIPYAALELDLVIARQICTALTAVCCTQVFFSVYFGGGPQSAA